MSSRLEEYRRLKKLQTETTLKKKEENEAAEAELKKKAENEAAEAAKQEDERRREEEEALGIADLSPQEKKKFFNELRFNQEYQGYLQSERSLRSRGDMVLKPMTKSTYRTLHKGNTSFHPENYGYQATKEYRPTEENIAKMSRFQRAKYHTMRKASNVGSFVGQGIVGLINKSGLTEGNSENNDDESNMLGLTQVIRGTRRKVKETARGVKGYFTQEPKKYNKQGREVLSNAKLRKAIMNKVGYDPTLPTPTLSYEYTPSYSFNSYTASPDAYNYLGPMKWNTAASANGMTWGTTWAPNSYSSGLAQAPVASQAPPPWAPMVSKTGTSPWATRRRGGKQKTQNLFSKTQRGTRRR
jgi:hypothetical protein